MRNSIKNWAAALLWLAASSLPLYAQDVSTDTLSEEPLPLPFVEYFDSEESLANWTIRDSAGNILPDSISDGQVKSISRGGIGQSPYIAMSQSNNNTYLVSSPLNLATNKAYVSLYVKTTMLDSIHVLIGNTPVVKDMRILYSIFPESRNTWQHIICEFENEIDPVYFSFRTDSPVLYLDAIEVQEGTFSPHALLNLISISSTNRNDTIDLNLQIANEGTASAYGMTVSYDINGREYHQIELSDTITNSVSKEITISNIPLRTGSNRVSANLLDFPESNVVSTLFYRQGTLYPPHLINLSKGEMSGGDFQFTDSYTEYGALLNENNTPTIIYTTNGSENPITSTPFYLEAGIEYQIEFDCTGGTSGGTGGGTSIGDVQLIIGKANKNHDEWEVLWTDYIQYTSPLVWTTNVVKFRISETGLYSFGFSAPKRRPNCVVVRNIKIELANDENEYDIALTNTLGGYLPLSECGLDQLEVTAMVQNRGSSAIHGFDAYYILNETDTVREYIYADIAPNAIAKIAFNEYALLNKGKNTVRVNLEMYKDMDTSNNISKLSEKHVIYNHLPLQTPHTIDFTKEEMGISTIEHYREWSLAQLENGEWIIGMTNGTTFISSTCFELQAGTTYCLSFDYCGGSSYNSGRQFPVKPCISVYNIADSSESIMEIWMESDVLTYDYQKREVFFSVEEDGFYAFSFGKRDENYYRSGRVSYKNISLTQVSEYDISTELLSGLSSHIPLEHVKGELPISLLVENDGLLEANAKVEISMNGETAGTVTAILLPKETKELKISAKSENMEIGDTVTLFIQGSIEGHEDEDINPGHELSRTFTISDTNMTYYQSPNLDVVWGFTTASYAINGPRGIAMPFRFSHPDTLTSISIGWAYLYDSQLPQLQLAIYPFDVVNQKIADIAIYQSEISRPRDSGWMVYDIPDLLLSGDVLACIMQMDHNNMGISVDRSLEGYYYRYTLMTDSLWKETLAGYPAIALNLGHNGVLDLKQDAEMVAFINPSANIGAFAANEPITVRIRNNSADSVDVPVHLLINNQEAGSTTLRIAPFVSGNAVIEADLSQPNTQYDICVFAAMENDEDRSNDTLRMSLTTVPAMDPYLMDFEYTPDFAISDFQEQWTSVDLDGYPALGWSNVSFPHTHEAFGFICFNPAQTTPAIDVSINSEFAPMQGRRYGASLRSNAETTHDLLISPKLQLPQAGSKISFLIKSLTKDYGYDQYRVLVSTTTNDFESFDPVTDFREAPDWEWKQEVVDLSAYNGQQVYIAIERLIEDGGYGYMLMIDDIRVDKTGTGTESDVSILDASLYPNPAQEKVTIFCDAGIQEVEIMDMNGRVLFAKQGLNQDTFVYNVENLSPGLYFAKVRSSQGLQVLKFTVIE